MTTGCGIYRLEDEALVITRPDTPRPWSNFLYTADGEMQAEISQRGLGTLWFHHRVNVASQGRNLVLLDRASGRCWSLNAGAAPQEAASYRCTHRPGRTTFDLAEDGLESTLQITLDPRRPLEVNRLELRETAGKPRRLALIVYHLVELSGPFKNDQVEISRFDESCGALICRRQHYLMPPFRYTAFLAGTLDPATWCGSWEDFIGADVDLSRAEIFRSGRLPCKEAYAGRPILALQYEIELPAHGCLPADFAFGLVNSFEEGAAEARRFRKEGAGPSLEANAAGFKRLLEHPRFETPDASLNRLLNTWTRVQLDRQVLSGRFAMWHNWRNDLQDALGWLPFHPERAAWRLRGVCAAAEADGFMPRTTAQVEGLADAPSQHHMDIATWAGFLAGRYYGETGDLDLFRETVRVAGGSREGTVGEGVARGLQWLLEHRGRHGLVLLWEGDWSDPLEEAGKRRIGESPWTSVALVHALRHFLPVAEALGFREAAANFSRGIEELSRAVNEHAWDGAWYIRGITDDGVRFCTASDPDANVSLMMQAWAILSGVVPPDRLPAVVAAVDSHCKTDLGPILYGPPFLAVRPELGRETVKQPGTGENGSVYTHAAMMWAAAELRLKRADEALRIIRQVMPLRDPETVAAARSLPLWWPNYWQGPHARHPGRCSGILSTGAPAWFFHNMIEGFFGLRAGPDGMTIDPCFPSAWNEARLTRSWRGAVHDFRFRREPGVGALQVELNGRALETPLLPVPDGPAPRQVLVRFP